VTKIKKRFFLGLFVVFALFSCKEMSTLSLEHDAYIWQYKWTPAVVDAMRQSSGYIKKWRILVAEVSKTGEVKKIPTDIAKYAVNRKDIVLVIRINGQLSAWDPAKTAQAIATLIKAFETSKMQIVGVEIDHDCATSKLQGYIDFLKKIRTLAFLKNKTLSITALPAWLDSRFFAPLLSLADEAVLQVHSVSDPKQGLINAAKVKKWLIAFDQITPVPFYVALPTYSSKVAWNKQGDIIGVESEVRRSFSQKNTKNLIADPRVISDLIIDLQQSNLQWLKGIAWFRLPTKNDRRAWSMATWIHLLQEKKVAPHLEVIAFNGYINGAYDIHLMNTGNIDTTLPLKINVSPSSFCYAADALRYYEYHHQRNGAIVFQRVQQGMLNVGQKHIIGWVHCKGKKVTMDVQI
jgi:hypothetical protein